MKKFIRAVAILLTITLLMKIPLGVHASETRADKLEHERQLIATYVECIDQENWEELSKLFCEESKEELQSFLNNTENAVAKIGYFNFASAEIVSLELCAENYESADFEINDYEGIMTLSAWECVLDVKTHQDTKYLTSGKNYFTFIVGWQNGVPVIVGKLRDKIRTEEINQAEESTTEQELNWGVSVLSYDAPVSYSGIGTWKNPETIIVEGYGTIPFKTYCFRVTANEVGSDSYNQTARTAVALAIKNYAWHRIVGQKYSDYEYDIRPTSTDDQTYNETTTITPYVRMAVNTIWDYVMLSCDYNLFCGFYRKNSDSCSYAVQHGGMLSQLEAEDLAKANYSWQDILHYYYDYGTYNKEMTPGTIRIISLSHETTGTYSNNVNYHWRVCTTCGCIHEKIAHTWISVTGGGYICSVCKCTKAVSALSLKTEAPIILLE